MGRIHDAMCDDGIPIWDYPWSGVGSTAPTRTTASTGSTNIPEVGSTTPTQVMCNLNGEYDGQYGVDRWPPVPSGHHSVVNCSEGNGKMRWKCLTDGRFDESGPDFNECWLQELLERNISSVEDVIQCLEEMREKTENKDSLNSMKSLNSILRIVSKLDHFMQNSTFDPSEAQNISESFVQVFSQTIDQRKAWLSGHRRERIRTASELLSWIERTAFLTNCYLSSSEKLFVSDNLFEKLFFNFSENIVFEHNSSSIEIEVKEPEAEEDNCREKSGLGALISSLGEYLTEDNRFVVNSDLIAFSFRQREDLRGRHIRIR